MSNETINAGAPVDELLPAQDNSFAEILSSFEQQHADAKEGETVQGTIVSVGPELILVDIGRKMEGAILVEKWKETHGGEPKSGENITVSVGPRTLDGYYELSTIKVQRPKDWSGLQAAYDEKRAIAGVVVEQVKGGFR